MIKRIAASVLGLLVFSFSAHADKLTKSPVDLQLYGDLESVYKEQTNYKSFLDSKDTVGSSGTDVRDGANNRASQNVRSTGSLTMVGTAGENDYQGTKWHRLIGVAVIRLNPNDPDKETDEHADGAYGDVVELGDVWVRYAPAVMLGVKIGTQTIKATANAIGFDHVFKGDIDGDFPFYSVTILDQKPGISIDLHPSEKIELGIGKLQGMSDFSQFLSMGKNSEADNTVLWFSGEFGLVNLTAGYQSIAVGGTETDGDGITSYKHDSKHTLLNIAARLNLGRFSPFVGIQQGQGDRVSARSWKTLATQLAAMGATLNNTLDSKDVKASTQTAGFTYNFGDQGKLAFEYTKLDTPAWGEEGSLEVMAEYENSMHLSYEYPITDSSSLSLFYYANGTRKDDNLREDIATLKQVETMLGSSHAFYSTIVDARKGLEIMQTTPTTSFGIAFNMAFGN